jgi:hypothetical protein
MLIKVFRLFMCCALGLQVADYMLVMVFRRLIMVFRWLMVVFRWLMVVFRWLMMVFMLLKVGH